MKSVLMTAFEPYDRWEANSSWLTLVALTQNLPDTVRLVTRLYPVNFSQVRERLAADLAGNYDYALHLGQAPGSGRIRLEAFGLNIGGSSSLPPEQFRPLVNEGPEAYRSELPLAVWSEKLNAAGIPSAVSYHAGTFLCNATMYLSCHLAEQLALRTKSVFIHLPLDVSQVASQSHDVASLPVATSAAALRLILDELVHQPEL